MSIPSPRSPKDNKAKSPGSYSSSFSPVPITSSPRPNKKVKVIFQPAVEVGEEYPPLLDEINVIDPHLLEGCRSLHDESAQSKQNLKPRPILRKHLKISKKYFNPVQMFYYGSPKDLIKFYSQGTQLSGNSFEINEMLKYLIETGQFEKLEIVYEHEKVHVLDFIMKGENVDIFKISELVKIMFARDEEIILTVQEETDLFSIKTSAFLHAVEFKIEYVYKMFNDLIDDPMNTDRLRLAREILKFYYTDHRMPLLMYAAKHDSEEAVQSILDFEPEEAGRLDSNGCSFIYHAACEGNLDILDSLKDLFIGQAIPGQCPLIGAALNSRDDSLSFFLEDERSKDYFNFTEKEIEDAAFASATSGSFASLRVLKRATSLNLYCYHENFTLLSTSLKNNQLGYALALVERLGYNVNFVGDDPINPDGHALIFLLDKLTTCKTFLDMGANRNVMIPITVKDIEGEKDEEIILVPLREYVENSGNTKLIQLFNKYQ